MTAADHCEIRALAAAIAQQPGFGDVTTQDLRRLRRKGVSHDHYAISGHAAVARVPRLSQWDFDPRQLIDYERAAFMRSAPSGHTPTLRAVIPPSRDMSTGALLVQHVLGTAPNLPTDMAAIAEALAAIHMLRVPPKENWPPLAQTVSVSATVQRIEQQARHLPAADIHAETRTQIDEDRDWARHFAAEHALPDPAPVLVGTDTHPGNFLIDAAGKAWFVDLEKAAYGNPAIDLAHASLPTSTGWDPDCGGDVDADDAASFHTVYRETVGPDLWAAIQPWLLPARRLTWLRTITWFARWRADFAHTKAAPDHPDIRAHIDRHIDACLQPASVARVRRQWTAPHRFPFH